MVVSHEHRFIFIHVPKTGGSSIKWELEKHFFPGSEGGILSSDPKYRFRGDLADPDYRDYFKFCFVRNPWDRVVSAYNELMKNPAKDKLRAKILSILGMGTMDFDAFVRLCVGSPRQRQTCLKNQHWMPQNPLFTDSGGNVLVDFVGRLESFDKDFTAVAGRLGMPPRVERVNAWPHAHYRTWYTPETHQIVADVYQQDLELLGYEF